MQADWGEAASEQDLLSRCVHSFLDRHHSSLLWNPEAVASVL